MRIVGFVVAASVTLWVGLGVHAQLASQAPAGGRGRGDGTPEESEPVIGLPGGAPPTTAAPGRGRGK